MFCFALDTMTQEEVEKFLGDFKVKKRVWGIVFYNRPKNNQALADLGIIGSFREKVIDDLHFTDYSEGPLEDEFFGKSEMWVFGKEVKDLEVYIKITMGNRDNSTICISFHPSERAMTYPLRENTKNK